MKDLELKPNERAWVWSITAAIAVVLFALFTVWCQCGPLG